MKEVIGNMWDFGPEHNKVIPTNIGWRRDGTNVMGRGLAQQAASRYPELEKYYGNMCKLMANLDNYTILSYRDLILFPVKPLDKQNPNLSWKQGADILLIQQGLIDLAVTGEGDSIIVPLVGCGNGGLDEELVLPLIELYLGGDDRFTLLRWKGQR